MNINKLLKPQKLALVGASENENLGGFTARMLMNHGKERLQDIYWVNPGRDEIFGMKCYHSISELPSAIDLIIVATAKNTVEAVLREAYDKGAGAAVVFASGYGETGKAEDILAESRLLALCKELDMALMGPNCAGYLNFVDNVIAMGFLATVKNATGSVGLVSQSGMICTLLMDSAKTDFSYVISCGNSKVVEVVDYIDFLIDDESTKVIAAYIEGVNNPEKFVKVLRKAAMCHKPIVLLKIGSSEAGSLSAASHTGSLSGSDKAFEAIFDKFGVIRVDDLEDLASITNMLATLPVLPSKNAIASINGAGGETGIAADAGTAHGFYYPSFQTETVKELKEILPDYASVHNPLDTTATPAYNTEAFSHVLEIIANDKSVEMLMITITLIEEITDLCVKHMTEGIIDFKKRTGSTIPIVVVPSIEAGRMESVVKSLKEVGVPILSPLSYAYKHIKLLLKYVSWRNSLADRTLELAIPKTMEGESRALSEHESKLLFKEYGIPIPMEYMANTCEEAEGYATKLGFPVVMKVESADILHKSDAGGVKLNLQSVKEVKSAYREILENCNAYMPDARINGILMQGMLPKGMEVIIGVNCDPLFGPMVLLGLGGIFVEIFKDVALYPAPFGRKEAEGMIKSLKSYPMFTGYRGQKKLDTEALIDVLLAVSNFAVANKDSLIEADINPLFVYEKGVWAADGLIILKK